MGSRSLHSDSTQGIGHVEYDFSLTPQGAANPLGGEGTAGNFFTWARTGAGVYTVTLMDKYVAPVVQSFSLALATPVSTWNLVPTAPVKNAAGFWVFSFTAFFTGVATDIPNTAGNSVSCYLKMRNSTVTP